MRDEIRQPVEWISIRRRNETGKQSWSSRLRNSSSTGIVSESLTVDAVDAAFEDVELEPSHQPPHRIDSGTYAGDDPVELVGKLTMQLAALEAQCHHLQGLLNSVKS